MEPEDDFENFPLTDSVDKEILMHRDAHFGGQFPIMLDYYREEGKGVNPNFDLSRIESLAAAEMQMKQNLAPLILSGADADKVAQAKEAYKKLRDVYEVENPKSPHPRLIADLILSEEENPEKEIEAIVAQKGAIVPALIELLRSEEIYDSLFPGYGLASSSIVRCLERIGDKRAIISLFEAIGHGDFDEDDLIFRALKAIGEPAKEFLLRVVSSKPINEDNERAAIALIQFKDDQQVGLHCLKLLQKPEFQKDESLATYFVLTCESLLNTPHRKEFLALAENPNLPSTVRQDIKALAHEK